MLNRNRNQQNPLNKQPLHKQPLRADHKSLGGNRESNTRNLNQPTKGNNPYKGNREPNQKGW